MEVLSKFSLYTGTQTRTSYRVVRINDCLYSIEEYLPNLKEWTPVYKKTFATERELLSSVQFKNLFIPQ